MAYCGTFDVTTLARIVHSQLGFASAVTYNAWIAGTLIPQAQKFIDLFCGHDFTHHSAGTLIVDGTGKEVLWVTNKGLIDGAPAILLPAPFITVTAVTIGTTSVLPIGNIKVYQRYLAYEHNKFTRGRQNVTIVCDWGYLTVPDDIAYVTAQICTNVLTWMIRNRMMPDDITPYLEEGRSIGIFFRNPKIFTKNERFLLKKYIILQVALG